ncbi:MAG TPA: tetratricopeptide repeat protein [Dokdonella sp.]
MSAALAEFHFLRPLALLLLLALPALWRLWRSGRIDAGAWRGTVDAHLLPYLLERVDARAGRGGLALAAATWTLAVLALAGPAWEREPMPLYRNQAARVLALELAPTMLAQDEKPNRLSRARYKLADMLARSRAYQTALIGYAGDAFVAAPLTDDVGTVANLVDALDPSTMPVAGNATARAIETGVALIEQAGLHRGEIVLLADAVSTDAVAAARAARAHGVVVSALGIGNTSGAPVPLAQGDFLKDDDGNVVVSKLDEAGLRAVADAGGGRYAALSAGTHDLDVLLADRAGGEGAAEPGAGASGVAESARWRDRGPWLLLLLVPFALLGFRRGWLLALAAAVVLAAPPHARAASLADLWRRPDQQAAAALADGDAKQAARVARSPEWRASAAYRAGDFAAAAAAYAQANGADAAYNRGNALAKLGRYEDALAAYDEALKLAPDMADAQANRQAVEAFLKQQQKPPSSDDSSQSGRSPKSPDDASDSRKSDADARNDASSKSPSDAQSGQSGQSDSPRPDPAQSDSAQAGDAPQPDAHERREQGQDGADPKQDRDAGASGGDADRQRGDKPAADAAAQKPDAEQQQALSQQIDKALAAPTPQGGASDAKPQAGVAADDAATSEKKQALEHWLQRVPDDPGGLLRRKFQLEYQRRQQRGGDGG